MSEKTKIITIEEIEDKDYEGKDYKRVFDGSTHYNIKQGREGSLKAKWAILEKGNQIKLTFGEYNHKEFVKDIELVGPGKLTPISPPSPLPLARPASTNSSIEQQVAVKAVVELWMADKLKDSDNEVQGMREWICERLPSTSSEPLPIAKPTPSLVEAAIEEGAIPEFANKGDFLTQVYKHFGYTRNQALTKLGKTLEGLNDLQGAWRFLMTLQEREEEDEAKQNQPD